MVTKKKNNKKEETITIKKDTLWKIVSGILALVLISVLLNSNNEGGVDSGVAIKPTPSEARGNTQNPTAPEANPSLPSMEELIDDDSIKGDPNAPVTIVEWSDYECPFCEKFYSQAYKQIVEKYIETGKVKFVYRDFPLSFHPNAQKAAEAAECAGEQGKYYEMHDLLFESGVTGGTNSFKSFAEQIGLDTDEFNTCLDSGRMASEVKKDMSDGANIGIRGTPGFIINGVAVSGAQPFSAFEQIIESELAKLS